jgi:hypothetical protein
MNLHQHLETTILFRESQVFILYTLEKHDFKDLADPIKKLKAKHFENVAVMVNDFVNKAKVSFAKLLIQFNFEEELLDDYFQKLF